jgi:NAD(P)-dependent dehydrogenase (short-subunit alcohol dehydrogenase family)
VMAINGLAPMIINAKLKPCLCNRDGETDQTEGRFVINVSAMEGQFYRFKQSTHPHTNMAKAALNMMTRTSGTDYAASCIFMNSVDTGWITDESPLSKKQRRADAEQLCPLDEVDAAARCLDLIYTDSKEHSKFFKDYHEIPW